MRFSSLKKRAFTVRSLNSVSHFPVSTRTLCLSLSLSLPLLFFSEWLLFHVGCPCWKNQSNVVFTLKSHCFHDYEKTKADLFLSPSHSVSPQLCLSVGSMNFPRIAAFSRSIEQTLSCSADPGVVRSVKQAVLSTSPPFEPPSF